VTSWQRKRKQERLLLTLQTLTTLDYLNVMVNVAPF